MKRYAVFLFKHCYPEGGCSDFVGFVDNSKELKNLIIEKYDSQYSYLLNILDIKTEKKFFEEYYYDLSGYKYELDMESLENLTIEFEKLIES